MAAVSSGMNSNAPPSKSLTLSLSRHAQESSPSCVTYDSQLREIRAVFAGLKEEAEDVEELVTAKDVMIANAVEVNQQLAANA